jgi:hypothetical protein
MGKRFKRSWSTAAPRKTMRGRRTHTCRGRAAPSWGSHGQRQFRGWLSGRWAGGRACSPHGAALQDLPRLAAKRCDGLQGKDRLLEPCRKQRRFDRGQPEPDSSSEARDRMPGANGWTGRSCVIGCWPPMPSCAMSASGAAVGAAATWTGTGERAKGARTRRAANHPESRGCSLSQRCARAPTGTSVVSRARPEAAHRGASRQQQRMVPPKRVVKSP